MSIPRKSSFEHHRQQVRDGKITSVQFSGMYLKYGWKYYESQYLLTPGQIADMTGYHPESELSKICAMAMGVPLAGVAGSIFIPAIVEGVVAAAPVVINAATTTGSVTMNLGINYMRRFGWLCIANGTLNYAKQSVSSGDADLENKSVSGLIGSFFIPINASFTKQATFGAIDAFFNVSYATKEGGWHWSGAFGKGNIPLAMLKATTNVLGSGGGAVAKLGLGFTGLNNVFANMIQVYADRQFNDAFNDQ